MRLLLLLPQPPCIFCSQVRIGILVVLVVLSMPGCSRKETQLTETRVAHVIVKHDTKLRLQQLSPEGQELRDRAIENTDMPQSCASKQSCRAELEEFYASLGGTFGWITDGHPTPQGSALVSLLQNAETNGLDSEDYDGTAWNDRLQRLRSSNNPAESELVEFDVALTGFTMKYLSDLHIGRVNPQLSHFGLDIDPHNIDMSDFLHQQLVSAQNIAEVVKAVEPPFPAYRRAVAALAEYRELASQDHGETLSVPQRPTKVGSYSSIPRLITLLSLFGDLPEPATTDTSDPLFTDQVVEAVKRFQVRHGLDPTGLLDARTVRELNVPISRRVTQLELTLERSRWLPHEFMNSPVVVNVPEFALRVEGNDNDPGLAMRVVVGGAYEHQTPIFASEIRSVILRPVWDVPASIQEKELIPIIKRNPSYVKKHSYELVDGKGRVIEGDKLSRTQVTRQLESQTLRLRQRAGPANALGLMKFDLPNPYSVYLHGTPAEQAFDRTRRDLSHGCIRVEDPVALAAWLLRDNPQWTAGSIRAAAEGSETMTINLDNPAPILILYNTAVAMEDGEVRFFSDIYEQDMALESALLKRSTNATQSGR